MLILKLEMGRSEFKEFDLLGRLLIWEECHYEPSKSSLPTHISGAGSTEIPFGEWERLWISSETCSSRLGRQVGDRVATLISKMIINNQFNIVGEGYEFLPSPNYSALFGCHFLASLIGVFFFTVFRMVGRAAFTGNHQWILSNSYTKCVHPPEV